MKRSSSSPQAACQDREQLPGKSALFQGSEAACKARFCQDAPHKD